MGRLHPPAHLRHAGVDLPDVDAGGRTGHHPEPVGLGAMEEEGCGQGRAVGHGEPETRRAAQAVESRRGDADDRHGASVEDDVPAHDAPVAAEVVHPEPVAEDGDRRRLRDVVVVRERPPHGGLGAEHAEVGGRDQLRAQALGVARAREGHGADGEGRRRLHGERRLVLEDDELGVRPREAPGRPGSGGGGVGELQEHELVGVGVGWWREEGRPHRREDHRVRPDAQRQHDHRREGEARRLPQGADRHLQVHPPVAPHPRPPSPPVAFAPPLSHAAGHHVPQHPDREEHPARPRRPVLEGPNGRRLDLGAVTRPSSPRVGGEGQPEDPPEDPVTTLPFHQVPGTRSAPRATSRSRARRADSARATASPRSLAR